MLLLGGAFPSNTGRAVVYQLPPPPSEGDGFGQYDDEEENDGIEATKT